MTPTAPPDGDTTTSTRRFQLNRREDVSGVSGLGIVAEGCQFHDGQCVLSWFGQHHVIGVYPSIRAVELLHGHEGRTEVEWLDAA